MILLSFVISAWGNPKGDIVGIWSARGVTIADVQIHQTNQGVLEGTIIQCETQEWIGNVLLSDFVLQSNDTWKAILHSPRYSVSKEVSIVRKSHDEIEIRANFVIFEKTFIWKLISK